LSAPVNTTVTDILCLWREGNMKTTVLMLAALLLVSGVAFAEEKVENAAPGTSARSYGCDEEDYMCYLTLINVDIPDNDPAGVLHYPLETDPGYIIQDVIISANIGHTWVGDLIIKIGYSLDCSDSFDVEGGILDRHSVPESTFGCSGDLSGWYGFDDAQSSIEDVCEDPMPAVCYGPDYDSIGLDVFDGLPTGGCFWLWAADMAGADVGTIYAWEVCILGEPIPPAGGALDIKPESCPNPFNVKAMGQLPVAVLSTADFDATMIDVTTLSLECPNGSTAPIRSTLSDVATPIGAGAEPCECTEEGPDGMTDLKLSFWRQDILAVLGPVDDGDEVELTLTGSLMDGTPFAVSDCIEIIKRGKLFNAAAPDGAASAVTNSREGNETTWSTIKALYR
jgi:subtilisin-like proprotein convertase family protein